jgi:hypothetical protein
MTQAVTTASDGTFVLTGSFACGTATEVYLVATGGKAGQSVANANLTLMTALGPCSSITTSTYVYVNEVTTVATVTALAPYMNPASTTPANTVASGSTDAAALGSAFAFAAQLANDATGTSPGTSIPANMSVPSAQLNSLADILSPCVNSTGGAAGDGSACGKLFTDTTPLAGKAPANTVAAALNLALNPTLNTAVLSALAPAGGPFQPQLTYVPPSFAITLLTNPLQFSASALTLASTAIGATPSTATLTVMNPTSSTVTLNSVALGGANAGDFSDSSTCAAAVAAGSACTVQVSFAPTAAGARGAQLSVADAALTDQVALTGNGLPGQNLQFYSSLCVSPKIVCLASIAAAVKDAATYFASFDATYTMTLPAGTFDFSDETTINGVTPNGVFDVSGIRPTNGLLIITGAGSAMTTLISHNQLTTINGTNVAHIHFNGMSLMRGTLQVTQGIVTSSAAGQVTLTIMQGFPTPVQLYGAFAGMYLRVYDNTNPLNPHMNVDPTNTQIAWGDNQAPVCTGMSCTLYFDNAKTVLPAIYTEANQIVCVKEEGGGQAYYFNDISSKLGTGTDIGFNDIIWFDSARGVFRDIINPFVTNSAIHRRPPTNGQQECMADAAGGPQFGQPGDGAYPLTGVLVNNFESDATGDDTIAIFNDATTTDSVMNTTISNAFARTINLYNSCHIVLGNNVGNYCSPQFDNPTQYGGCITDTSPSPTPCTPNL